MTTAIDLGAWYVARIKTRLYQQNKNWLACICGEPGSGKSYAALRLAELISGERLHIVLTAVEFLEVVNSPKLRRGDTIIFDEAGVGASSREWQSVQNKMLGAVAQTVRHRNTAIILTVPHIGFVDIQMRKLMHAFMQTRYIDFKTGLSYLQTFDIETNPRLDKMYYKYPKFTTADNKVITMTHLALDKPSNDLTMRYEELKTAFTKRLNQQALDSVRATLEPPESKRRASHDFIGLRDEVLADRAKYVREYQGREFLDLQRIQIELDLPEYAAKRVRRLVEDASAAGVYETADSTKQRELGRNEKK